MDNNTYADRTMREDLTHASQRFPLSEFVDNFDSFAGRGFPSHWHHEFELQILLHGSAEYNVNGTSYFVKEGSAIYIAPEAVHMARAYTPGTTGYDIVLAPQFLIGILRAANCESAADALTSRRPDAFVITPERKETHAILELLKRMYYTESTSSTYELFLLECLLGIWRNLIALFPRAVNTAEESGKKLREERMKIMLNFIRQHYSTPISVSDIAASAAISKSECFRCFSELSERTPIDYVSEFRLLQAAHLLAATEKSIADICYETGFNNTSYFSKKFREQYGVTPKAYRVARME